MKRMGVIGVGNMGGAILSGALAGGCLLPGEAMACDRDPQRLADLGASFPGLTCTQDAAALARECEIILLAVKPQGMGEALEAIRGALRGQAVVSIAAGWTLAQLREGLQGAPAALLRAMPNTPARVRAGMTALCPAPGFPAEKLSAIQAVFDALGRTAVVDESLLDGVTAVSGSGPAYCFMMLEAMGDAAVREGLPRALAYEMAAQTMLGAARMVLESGEHPAALKDAVCSPGGTTIEAVAALEKAGLRSALLEGMAACAAKSRAMAKK